MSYDLYFLASDAPWTPAAIREHFQDRLHYQVSESQVFYENENTHVYFSFDISDEDEAEASDEEKGRGVPVRVVELEDPEGGPAHRVIEPTEPE